MIDFRLCIVTDGRAPDNVRTACSAGVRAVQYRNKTIDARSAHERSLELREVTTRHSAWLFINERIDIARAVGADGVHCPEEGFPADEARAILLGSALVGASVHSLDTARRAEQEGADFVFVGPVFETPSKAAFGPPLGAGALSKVCVNVNIPVFAIGGVTPHNAQACLDAGAHGVAVVSAILDQPHVGRAVIAFRDAIGTL